jgi:hypothetical protein
MAVLADLEIGGLQTEDRTIVFIQRDDVEFHEITRRHRQSLETANHCRENDCEGRDAHDLLFGALQRYCLVYDAHYGFADPVIGNRRNLNPRGFGCVGRTA